MKLGLQIFSGLLLVSFIIFATFIAVNWAPDRSVEELKSRWAQPPSQFIEINKMQVHLRDEGLREDPTPIILLHGTSASLHTWDGWVDALKDEHRIIRFDLPGFGLTGPSPDNNYTVESYAQVVISVLDQLEIDNAIIAGNSLGGHVAWATAVLHPDRIKQLILIDSSGIPFEAESVPIAFTIANTPVLNRLVEFVLPRGMIESSLKNVYGDPSLVTPELIDLYYDIAIRAGNRQALVERLRQMQAEQLTVNISNIKIPTLILWGGRDNLIPSSVGERFHKKIAGSQLVIFNELGHVPQEEEPQRTVLVFKEFLEQQNE